MMASLKKGRTTLDVKEIQKILPHRYPFLLVDKIIKIDCEEEFILGQKNLTINELFFQGHFPGAPIMPGVLIIEALAQTGAVYLFERGYNRAKTAALLSVNKAKFRIPVHPGDVLMLECRKIHLSSRAGRFAARATVEGKLAAEAEIGFVFMDREQM